MCRIIAAKVRARSGGQPLFLTFIEAHSDPTDEQQMLPLWQ
jgi:hypothetical protein